MTDETKHSPLPWVEPHGVPSMLNAGHRHPMRSVLNSCRDRDTRKGGKPDAEDIANIALVKRRVNQGPAVDKLLEIAAELARDVIWSVKLGYGESLNKKALEFLKAYEK